MRQINEILCYRLVFETNFSSLQIERKKKNMYKIQSHERVASGVHNYTETCGTSCSRLHTHHIAKMQVVWLSSTLFRTNDILWVFTYGIRGKTVSISVFRFFFFIYLDGINWIKIPFNILIQGLWNIWFIQWNFINWNRQNC